MDVSSEHLAKEAERLKSDPIFNKALDDIRADALAELIKVDPDNKSNIIRLQQVAVLTEEIRNVLARYIMNGETAQEEPGSFA